MRGFGCWINRLERFGFEGSGILSLLEKMKTEIRAVREPDSLDIVEQAMEEEARQAKSNRAPASADWLCLANMVLVLTLVLFLLLAWRIR
jgi:hypothetical protein